VRRWLVIGAIAAVGAVALAVGLAHRPTAKAAAPPTGVDPTFARFRAPLFTATTLNGSQFSLASLRGHPVVINFWEQHCGPCAQEAPELSRFARAVPDGARMVGVAVTPNPGQARRFARAHGWGYPQILDASGSLSTAYGVGGLPSTVIIDARGVVVDTIVGMTSRAQLRAKLDSLA
jgi:cytochrome c biogenesis protein CcmG/thiol:disulfide interchange protein DsbE